MRIPYDVTVILPDNDSDDELDNLTEGVIDLASVQSYVRLIDEHHGECTEIASSDGFIRLLVPFQKFKAVMRRYFGAPNWFHLN